MFERLVGLHVVNEGGYQAYREAMYPILQQHGGDFGYDLRVSETLKNPAGHPINRVFTITFPDEAASDAFFSNEDYLAVRAEHFERSVEHVTIIATYEK